MKEELLVICRSIVLLPVLVVLSLNGFAQVEHILCSDLFQIGSDRPRVPFSSGHFTH